MQAIELLAPARTAEIAREAIMHGADAVYLGAPRFGARALAGNSLEDLRQLIPFAHLYGVRVYITLNTILYDDELEEARNLVFQLYEMGVDALIVQDMALLEMGLPPIPLHASTQMDVHDAAKVEWLYGLGFRQIVLARELTLKEISEIHHSVPDMQLEAFVHGATCVSFNGQCYASQYCFGRSANRGECAQFCRMPFDLVDDEGREVRHPQTGTPIRQQHLLSLHDMNRSEDLEAMLDAGVVSLKIEGRLKDMAYVKNITAYYRSLLDEIIKRRPDDFCRSSVGESIVSFTPNPYRTFNRGFSSYFLHGRTPGMVQLFSPKSVGQPVGHVKEMKNHSFTVSGTIPFANGDGLCFVNKNGQLEGFRVNRAEGNRIFPKEMPAGLQPGQRLYRNQDQAFTQQLEHPTAERRVLVSWTIEEEPSQSLEHTTSLLLTLRSEDGVTVKQSFPVELELARTPQSENIARQLSRLGDTPYKISSIQNYLSDNWFFPSSQLSNWRRHLVESLTQVRLQRHTSTSYMVSLPSSTSTFEVSSHHVGYLSNVANRLASQFYSSQGAKVVEKAFELQPDVRHRVLMTMRYCPRFELGLCRKCQSSPSLLPTLPSSGPLAERIAYNGGLQPSGSFFLRSSDGRLFPLFFDCRQCLVYLLTPIQGKPSHA